jgi:hypothetical protein
MRYQETGGARGTHGRNKKCSTKNHKEKDQFGDLGSDTQILKLILRTGSGTSSAARFSDDDDESSGSLTRNLFIS